MCEATQHPPARDSDASGSSLTRNPRRLRLARTLGASGEPEEPGWLARGFRIPSLGDKVFFNMRLGSSEDTESRNLDKNHLISLAHALD